MITETNIYIALIAASALLIFSIRLGVSLYQSN